MAEMKEKLSVVIEADTTDLQSDMRKARREVETFADKSENALEDYERAMRDAKDATANAVLSITGAFAGVAAGLVGLVQSTEEYSERQNRLIASFEAVGGSAETATAVFEDLYAVMGDADAATEATQLLSKITTDAEDLDEWVQALTGSWAAFGESIPLESLAEAANEASKTGDVVGALADSLNWVDWSGVDIAWIFDGNATAIQAFNDALDEGLTPAEAFQEALKTLTDEEKRADAVQRALIGTTKEYANEYNNLNSDIMESRRAQQRFATALAGLGDQLRPAMTALTEFGAKVLEDAEGPLGDVADTIEDDLLPALDGIYEWAQNNSEFVSGAFTAIGTAFLSWKLTNVFTDLVKGLENFTDVLSKNDDALKKTSEQWGKVRTFMGGLSAILTRVSGPAALAAGGIALLAGEIEKSWKPTQHLTEEQLKLIDAASEAADEYNELMDAVSDEEGVVMGEAGYMSKLAAELIKLGGESGYVEEKYRSRAQFILDELNKAYGIEAYMIEGQIQNYETLATYIQNVINKKTLESLLAANNEAYVTALQNEAGAWQAVVAAQEAYDAQLAVTKAAEEEYAEAQQALATATADARTEADYRALASLAQRVTNAEAQYNLEQGYLEELGVQLGDAGADYAMYQDDVLRYQEAMRLGQEGYTQEAIDLLLDAGQAWGDYASENAEAMAATIRSLEKNAIDTGVQAKFIREQFENGVAGYTEEMVTEAETAAEEAMTALENAVVEAQQAGVDVGYGFANGTTAEDVMATVRSKASTMINAFFSSARAAAQIHSPSKKAMEIGRYLSLGTAVGIDQEASEVAKSAQEMIDDAIVPVSLEMENFAYQDLNGAFGSSMSNIRQLEAGSMRNIEMMEALVNKLVTDNKADRPIVLNVDGETFARTAISTINKRTHDTGSLGLKIM